MRDEGPLRPPPPLGLPQVYGAQSWRDRLPRGWLALLLLAIVFAGMAILPVAALARYTTSDSRFCLGCHQAGDTPDRGVRSLVHPDLTKVGCTDCHSRPGQFVYEGYVHGFAAEPERVSPACERCHAEMRTKVDQAGFKFNFAGIRINHEKHISLGASCTTCHVNVAHDLRTPATNRPRMENCYTCHAQTENCAKCHETGIPAGAPPFAAPVVAGAHSDGRMIYLRACSGCHGPLGDRIREASLVAPTPLDEGTSAQWRRAIADGKGAMPPMARTKNGPLSEDQVSAVLGYIQSLRQASAAGKPNAQALFDRHCAGCHGSDGGRLPSVAMNTAEFWQDRSEDTVRAAINLGWGGMPGFGARAGGRLSTAEVQALAVYARGLGKTATAPAPAGPDGAAVYARACAGCHGPDGSALPGANLGSKEYLQGAGEARLIASTRDGRGGMPAMGKAKGGPLADEEITSIVKYLLSR